MFYKLDNKLLAQVQSNLAQRKAAQVAQTASTPPAAGLAAR